MVNPRTPILVSGAQFTQRTVKEKKIQESLSPIEMLAKVARAAIADGGAGDKLTRAIDTISIVRFTADSPGDQGRLPKRMFRNPPLSVAKHLGITPRDLHGNGRQHAAMAGQSHGGRNRAWRMRGRVAGGRGIYRHAARRDESGCRSRLGQQR